MTYGLPTITYESFVSRDNVLISLTINALNGLQVKVADIINTYVTAPVQEEMWTVLGPDFGEDKVNNDLIVHALYGLKISGDPFRNYLANFMKNIGPSPYLADPDLWMKPKVRTDERTFYYAYILCYVDYTLSINPDSEDVLKRLDNYFKLKPGILVEPHIYLGDKIRKMRMNNGVWE